MCIKRKNKKDNKKEEEEKITPGPIRLIGKSVSREALTPEQSIRAKENWKKLRGHIKKMRNHANFLVKSLDKEDEIKQEQ